MSHQNTNDYAVRLINQANSIIRQIAQHEHRIIELNLTGESEHVKDARVEFYVQRISALRIELRMVELKMEDEWKGCPVLKM